MAKLVALQINSYSKDKNFHTAIIEDEKNMVLIDCGYHPNDLEKYYQQGEILGFDLGLLTHIIITHHDFDHIAVLSGLKERYPKVIVAASELQAEYLEGRKIAVRLEEAMAAYDGLSDEGEKQNNLAYQGMIKSVKSTKVDLIVKDGDILDICGGINIIGLEGHLPGHIGVYLPWCKTLIPGDALNAENGKLKGPNPIYTLDMKEAIKSVGKLKNLDIETIICPHGGRCTENIQQSLEEISKTEV